MGLRNFSALNVTSTYPVKYDTIYYGIEYHRKYHFTETDSYTSLISTNWHNTWVT